MEVRSSLRAWRPAQGRRRVSHGAGAVRGLCSHGQWYSPRLLVLTSLPGSLLVHPMSRAAQPRSCSGDTVREEASRLCSGPPDAHASAQGHIEHLGCAWREGTYYPPCDAYGRPGFPTVLRKIAEARAPPAAACGALSAVLRTTARCVHGSCSGRPRAGVGLRQGQDQGERGRHHGAAVRGCCRPRCCPVPLHSLVCQMSRVACAAWLHMC